MKKTILLAVLALILAVMSCSKSDSSCAYNADALKGKLYKRIGLTTDTNSVRQSSVTYNDSNQYSISFSDGSSGIIIVKLQEPNKPLVEYTTKIDYTVLSGSNDLQIVVYNSSTSKNTTIVKVQSFDCSKMVLYSKYILQDKVYEFRETYLKQ